MSSEEKYYLEVDITDIVLAYQDSLFSIYTNIKNDMRNEEIDYPVNYKSWVTCLIDFATIFVQAYSERYNFEDLSPYYDEFYKTLLSADITTLTAVKKQRYTEQIESKMNEAYSILAYNIESQAEDFFITLAKYIVSAMTPYVKSIVSDQTKLAIKSEYRPTKNAPKLENELIDFENSEITFFPMPDRISLNTEKNNPMIKGPCYIRLELGIVT